MLNFSIYKTNRGYLGININKRLMKRIFIILYLSFLSEGVVAQNCPMPNPTFGLSSQQAIDNFPSNYPDCSIFEGTLYIRSGSDDPITNFNGLSQLEVINGALIIEDNTSLKNLEGLNNLKHINFLRIDRNIGLSDLKGLDNIRSINNLSIYENIELFSLEGLNSIQQIGSILLRNNNNLLNLGNLSELDSIGGSVIIHNNLQLQDFQGLHQITIINGNLEIWNNDALINLDGLENLEKVAGTLHVQHNDQLSLLTNFKLTHLGGLNLNNNPSLESLGSFNNLRIINGEVEVFQMNQLRNFLGLDEVKTINGELAVWDNPSLSSFQGLGNVHKIGGLNIWKELPLLEDLLGLENLRVVEDQFNLDKTHLINLTGLGQLDSVKGMLILAENHKLKDLSSLKNIRYVGRLNINWDYDDLLNFDSLEKVENSIQISNSSFIPNFPKLTTIKQLNIEGNPFLIDLSGLEQFTKIEYLLSIKGNAALINLKGLENLNSVRFLSISDNKVLKNLNGLENLERCINLSIWYNNQLNDIFSLSKINFLSHLEIKFNPNLAVCQLPSICHFAENKSGAKISDNAVGCNSIDQILESCTNISCSLEDLAFTSQVEIDSFAINYAGCRVINGDLIIEDAHGTIENLHGLASLHSVGKNIRIHGNTKLTSLSGLENIDFSSITGLEITQNPSLSACDMFNICPYLLDIDLEVSGNANGCEDSQRLFQDCENNCLLGSVILVSQQEIDDLTLNYPNCTEIEGNIIIKDKNNDITNLNGLENIQQINGFLRIVDNPSLQSLKGLNNLKFIGLDFQILGNNSLTNLEGLDSLQTIQETFVIQNNGNLTSLEGIETLKNINGWIGLDIRDNHSLVALKGINQITFEKDGIGIYNNSCLANLEGLENINFQKMKRFAIARCPSLSICATQSICNFIQNGGDYYFSQNGIGCRYNDEIIKQCEITPLSAISEQPESPLFYPNPTNGHLNLSLMKLQGSLYNIYSTTGKLVRSGIVQDNPSIDITSLSPGVYFVVINRNNEKFSNKILKR